VADPSRSEALARRRQLVAVLRVVVEPFGHVLYGDVVDPDTGDKAGFVGSAGVPAALEKWVIGALRRSVHDHRVRPTATDERVSKD
jgi:hypothetical protein